MRLTGRSGTIAAMPALKPTAFTATVTWLGLMAPREGPAPDAGAVGEMVLGFDGQAGSPYGGRTRASCSRVIAQHPRGTEIANVRQLSVLSAEELAEIGAELDLVPFDPAWAGASIVIEGIPDFTYVPPSSRLQAASGATLVIDMENRPCHQPGLTIEAAHPGKGKGFKAASRGRRGVTAWVERPGKLALGDILTLHIPDQPVWPHLDAARR